MPDMTPTDKLSLVDPAELAREEGRSSKQNAVVPYDSGDIDHCALGTFGSLAYPS